MPKSKRNKQVELSKTKKRGLEWKKHLFEEIRSSVDSYTNVFVFSVNDMRNSKMKNVREQWKHSRFFIGKNKIMAMALGRFAEEEYKPNLHKVGQQIKGQRALLFSNKSTEEVLSWFRSYSEGDFARSGNIATEDVKLMAGPLSQFPHSLEPYLRQLGLPTSLVKGVITLVKDHEVCKIGDILTPETAKILKLLGYEMAEFHITINCVWSQDGNFIPISEDAITDTEKNLKKKKKKSNSLKIEVTHTSPDTEEMEVEDVEDDDDEDGNQSDEFEPKKEDVSFSFPKIVTKEDASNTSLAKLSDSNSNTSTPKEKNNNLEENDDVIELICSVSKTPGEKEESNTPVAKLSSINSYTSTPKEKSNILENNEVIEVKSLISPQKEEIQQSVKETPVKQGKTNYSSKDVNEEDKESDTPKEISNNLEENNEVTEINTVIASQKDEIQEFVKETPKDTTKKTEIFSNDTRKSRSRKRKVNSENAALKNNSLLKTPDPNTSQDSPIFRELRNRSVKMSRKRKK